uniref:Uncharacterized protein n=1 Tax=viral metagenome TaxID=1070528 RepID=A0A6C0CH95_9ZZZZ
MKYLIVKGWLGFGDRLESLIMCVKFAQENNLQIYVDWTDSIWSHGEESFYKYFNIVNMPVLESLDDIPADSTVYPEYWKDKLKSPFTQEMMDNYDPNNILTNYLPKNPTFNCDVIVYVCVGKRLLYEDIQFFTNVFRVTDERILDEIRKRKSLYNLSTSIGIHVRGTDRVKNIHKRELSIQYMAVNAVMNGGLSGLKMVAVGDDKESVELWKRFFPDVKVLSSLSLENTIKKGIHNASKEELTLSKDEMNVDMLVDFFTLSSCARILTTFRDSRFAREARQLHPYLDTILRNE